MPVSYKCNAVISYMETKQCCIGRVNVMLLWCYYLFLEILDGRVAKMKPSLFKLGMYIVLLSKSYLNQKYILTIFLDPCTYIHFFIFLSCINNMVVHFWRTWLIFVECMIRAIQQLLANIHKQCSHLLTHDRLFYTSANQTTLLFYSHVLVLIVNMINCWRE